MLNLQTQLKSMNSAGSFVDASPHNESLRHRRYLSQNIDNIDNGPDDENKSIYQAQDIDGEGEHSFNFPTLDVLKNGSLDSIASDPDNSPLSVKSHSSFTMEYQKKPSKSISGITELHERSGNIECCTAKNRKKKNKGMENPLVSAVHFLGDGVSQVQFLGNQAVTNIACFLNIKLDENDLNGQSSPGDGIYHETES